MFLTTPQQTHHHNHAAAAAVVLLLLVAGVPFAHSNTTTPKFPAILIFGDSTVDTGNNNYIVTPFKGDFSPYGIDFPGKVATGRFSNGKLVPDIIASIVGLKDTVPPSLAPNLTDADIVTGVSFASAGSGYDDLTTSVSHVIPMSKQPGYLKSYINRLEGIVGKEEASRIVANALVIVSAGTNDFIFNFYDIPTRRNIIGIDKYQDFLQTKLHDFVKELYNLGCRKMLVSGVAPIGCLPIQMTAKSPTHRTCIDKENTDSQTYNAKLQRLLPQIEQELTGSKILYLDAYSPLMDIITNPQKYEFTETQKGCCGTGLLEVGPLCTPLTPVCSDHSRYVFFDSIHPSESTYKIVSQAIVDLISKSPGFVNE